MGMAVGLMLAANVLLPLQDALTKALIGSLPVGQVMLLRSLTVLVAVLLIGRGAVAGRMVRARMKGFMLLRGLINLAAWICFYMALRTLPLAQGVTIYFISPILVALIAGPLLGERMPLLHWAGAIIGFFGVMLASGVAEFRLSPAVGLAFLSAVLWALSLVMLRRTANAESTLVQVAFSSAVFVAVTAVPLLAGEVWQPSAAQAAAIAGVGLIGGAGQCAVYEAARRLPAPVLSSLEYSAILGGFGLGYLMFGEVPAPMVSIGAALIVGSGVIVVALERRRSRGPAAPHAG